MKITGWKALVIIMLAGHGVCELAKEAKDAYFKHQLIKTGKAMTEIGERLADLQKGNTVEQEEEDQ